MDLPIRFSLWVHSLGQVQNTSKVHHFQTAVAGSTTALLKNQEVGEKLMLNRSSLDARREPNRVCGEDQWDEKFIREMNRMYSAKDLKAKDQQCRSVNLTNDLVRNTRC